MLLGRKKEASKWCCPRIFPSPAVFKILLLLFLPLLVVVQCDYIIVRAVDTAKKCTSSSKERRRRSREYTHSLESCRNNLTTQNFYRVWVVGVYTGTHGVCFFCSGTFSETFFYSIYSWMAELCDQTKNNEHLRDTFYLASIAW